MAPPGSLLGPEPGRALVCWRIHSPLCLQSPSPGIHEWPNVLPQSTGKGRGRSYAHTLAPTSCVILSRSPNSAEPPSLSGRQGAMGVGTVDVNRNLGTWGGRSGRGVLPVLSLSCGVSSSAAGWPSRLGQPPRKAYSGPPTAWPLAHGSVLHQLVSLGSPPPPCTSLPRWNPSQNTVKWWGGRLDSKQTGSGPSQTDTQTLALEPRFSSRAFWWYCFAGNFCWVRIPYE